MSRGCILANQPRQDHPHAKAFAESDLRRAVVSAETSDADSHIAAVYPSVEPAKIRLDLR